MIRDNGPSGQNAVDFGICSCGCNSPQTTKLFNTYARISVAR